MPTNIIMPALELAQETGKVLRWLKSPGDSVQKGEPIVEIETDKVTVEIEAPASGVLRDVTARTGDVIPVGRTIATIFAAGEAGAGAAAPAVVPAASAAAAGGRAAPPPGPQPAGGKAGGKGEGTPPGPEKARGDRGRPRRGGDGPGGPQRAPPPPPPPS